MIDAVYYINLDKRTDRKEQFEARAMEAGFDQLIRYPAISLTKDQARAIPGLLEYQGDDNFHLKLSSARSHQNVIREAKTRNYEAVAIFEDDAVFCSGFKEKFPVYLAELEKMDDWDIAWLGCSPEPDFNDKSEKCTQISDNWWKNPGACWCIHASIVHKRFYDKALSINVLQDYPWDMALIHFDPSKRKYLISKELLVIQDDFSYSDVSESIMPRNSIFQHYYEQHVK